MSSRLTSTRAAVASGVVGLVLVLAAIVIPYLSETRVRDVVGVYWPPLHAFGDVRLGWLTIPAVLVAIVLVVGLPRLTRLPWRTLLLAAYASAWVWTMALASTDGTDGLARVFDRPGEYVYDAQRVDGIGTMLGEFVSRIPYTAADNWHTHVAGHPPGALLFFVLLDRLGIESSFWIGVVVVTIGSSAIVAVLVALRALGDESLARRALPWLVAAPWVVWMGANGDAVFTAVSAWGLCLLALASRANGRRRVVQAVAGGVLLGLCVYLSYGLVLLGILALAVVWIGGAWKVLPWALAGAVAVAAAFTAGGFAWWEAYPVLVERYHDGIASERPYEYWVWANVAAWTFTVGLVTWAAFPRVLHALRDRSDRAATVVSRLAAAGLVTIGVATLSGMSKAEVERIWMPFTVWVLAIPLLLPERWHRPALISQVVLALVAQTLLLTRW